MAAVAFARPSHPAMSLSYYPTPATTPTSPISPISPFSSIKRTFTMTSKTKSAKVPSLPKLQAPIVNYALLRSHHASAMRYIIAKLRYEQSHNLYLPGESAWREHNAAIQRLEEELKLVVSAQKSLDMFPDFCHAPTAPLVTKAYGPQTREEVEKNKAEIEKKDNEMNKELEKNFPFIKQLFIGPMTKAQARNDRLLRKALKEGDLNELTELLPSANLRMAMEAAGQGEKKVEKRRPYHEVRMEREKERIKVILEGEEARMAKLPKDDEKKVKIGPITKEEHLASLPVYGPKTRAEALLPIQREQRHVILNYLRKPWPQYDDEAAQLMEKLGRLAVKKLNHEAELKEKEKAKK